MNQEVVNIMGHADSEAACAVRHRTCPKVVLKISSLEDTGGHTIGIMTGTGSRGAGFLGHIPVEAVMADRTPHNAIGDGMATKLNGDVSAG